MYPVGTHRYHVSLHLPAFRRPLQTPRPNREGKCLEKGSTFTWQKFSLLWKATVWDAVSPKCAVGALCCPGSVFSGGIWVESWFLSRFHLQGYKFGMPHWQ